MDDNDPVIQLRALALAVEKLRTLQAHYVEDARTNWSVLDRNANSDDDRNRRRDNAKRDIRALEVKIDKMVRAIRAAHRVEGTDPALATVFDEDLGKTERYVEGIRELHSKIHKAYMWAHTSGYHKTLGYEELSRIKEFLNQIADKLVHAEVLLRRERVELSLYRPTRKDEPPAPFIPGHVYVSATSHQWACVAKVLTRTYTISNPDSIGPPSASEPYSVHDAKSLCGAKTRYPRGNGLAAGDYPLFREVCPDCVEALGESLAWARKEWSEWRDAWRVKARENLRRLLDELDAEGDGLELFDAARKGGS